MVTATVEERVIPNLSNKLILGAACIAAVIGIIDAIVEAEWDLLALFAIVLVLQAALWLHLSWGRPAVPLRADLVTWLRGQAVAGGESVERVADRAVGAYRMGLTGRDPDDDDG